MALAKTTPGIISITGKMAGNVFKRDASGQHVVSYPRKLSKPSSALQKPQRAWYGEHKRDEREDPLPKDPTKPPKTQNSAFVFSLVAATTYRDWTILEPDHVPLPDDPVVWAEALVLALNYMPPNGGLIGITQELIAWLLYRYYWLGNLMWGMDPADCWTLSTSLTVEWLNRAMANGRTLITSQWITAISHALTYTKGSASSNHWGHLTFHKWNLLLSTKTALIWAGLVARPSPEMLTIYKVPYPTPETPGPSPHLLFYAYQCWQLLPRTVFIKPTCIFQFLTSSTFRSWTWTFNDMILLYLGTAYKVAGEEYRMKADQSTLEYLAVPIGWSQSPSQSHMYLYNLDTLFTPD